MATPRQADYLLTLWTKTGKLKEICISKFGGSGSPRDLAQIAPGLREEILSMDSSRISRAITEAQQIVGWDPKLASATNRQKTYISYLEKIVFGHRKTNPLDEMSYAEADALIKDLRDYKAERSLRAESATYLRRVK